MTKDEIRQAAEADLSVFIKLVAPERVIGACHEEVIEWWTRSEAKTHQLLLFPRDHMKSTLVAFRVAWELTRDPTLRVLYISATSNLAEKQLSFIKTIFLSPIYRRYWPEHVNREESKRTKWTSSEIALDHPLRQAENIRDPSIFTGGLTTSLTGLHCDIAVLDDVVVFENAYTEEGRNKVRSQYSLLSSIEGADAREWVVGTRYHPKDLYSNLMSMREDLYDNEGHKTGEEPIYEVMQREVESSGDGTGEFLWPRQRRAKDGKVFGFDIQVLARKRGQYLDRTQFFAQYYNNPSDPDDAPVSSDKFQYYDKKFLKYTDGHWTYKDTKLNVFAAVDFAYSLRKTADYTAIVIVGIDTRNNIYVLDVDRFKTDRITDYYDHIFALINKWNFRKIRAEVSVAQSAIVKELKEKIKENGVALSIAEYRPTRNDGSKQERISAILEPRYDNHQVWHYRGGNCQVLEDELITRYPPHDDVKDALASAVEIAVKPTQRAEGRPTSVVWAGNRFRGNR
jgi:hypothetical protein